MPGWVGMGCIMPMYLQIGAIISVLITAHTTALTPVQRIHEQSDEESCTCSNWILMRVKKLQDEKIKKLLYGVICQI